MHFRLKSFLNINNILHASQHGFRLHYNTITAMTDLLDHVIKIKSKKLISLLIFIDVSKTFDSLTHTILLQKLHYYGTCGTVYNWFCSYLTNRLHYVQ